MPVRAPRSRSKTRSERRSAPRRPPTLGDWLRVVVPMLLLATLVVFAWRMGYFDLERPEKLASAAARARHRPWLVPAFLVAYATLVALASPVSPLAYGAGAVFGLVEGWLLVWAASLIGASAGYVLARTVWSESAKRLLGRHGRKLGELGQGNVFLRTLRLEMTPIVPFGLLNYAAGTTSVRFVPFLAGTGLGIAPMTLAIVYVGDRIRAGVRGSEPRAFLIAGVVIVAMFALSFVPGLARHGDDVADE